MDENELQILISAKFAELEAAMEEGARATHEGAEKIRHEAEGIRDSFEGLKETLTGLAEAFLIFKGIQWAGETIKEATELGEHLMRAQIITGMSAQTLQTLKFAAEATGVGFDMVTHAVERSAMMLTQLRAGNVSPGLAGAMKDLHLKKEDFADPNILFKMAEGLEHVQGSAQKMADVRAVFGRMGAELLPTLKELPELRAEFEKLGVALDENAIQKLDDADDAFNKLHTVWQLVKAQLVSDFAPAIESVGKLLTEILAQIDQFAKGKDMGQLGRDMAMSMLQAALTINDSLMPILREIFDVLRRIGWAAQVAVHPIAAIGASLEYMLGGNLQRSGEVFNYLAGLGTDAKKADEAIGGLDAKIREMIVHQQAQNLGAAVGNELSNMGLVDESKAKPPPPVLPPAIITPQEQIAKIQEATKIKVAGLQEETAALEQRLAYGQMLKSEELSEMQDVAERRYNLELAGLQSELKVEGLKPAEVEKINAQIASLDAKLAADRIKNATQVTVALRQEAIERLSTEKEIAANTLTIQSAQIESMASLDRIDKSEELAAKQNVEDQKFEAESARLNAILAIRNLDTKTQTDTANQLAKLRAEHAAQEIKSVAEIEKANIESFDSMATSVVEPFEKIGESLTDGAIKGTEKMRQVWRSALEGMVTDLAKTGLKSLLMGGQKDTIFESIFGRGLLGAAGSAMGAGQTGSQNSMLDAAMLRLRPMLHDLWMPIQSGFQQIFGMLGRNAVSSAAHGVGSGLSTSTVAAGVKEGVTHLGQLTQRGLTNLGGIFGGMFNFLGPIMTGIMGLFGFTMIKGTKTEIYEDAMVIAKISELGYMNAQTFLLAYIAQREALGTLFGIIPGIAGGGIMSASSGMVLGGGMGSGGQLAILHPYEMVLPAKYSEGLQDMINSGSTGGGVTHYHVKTEIHAQLLDGEDFGKFADKHAMKFGDAVVAAHKRNHGPLQKTLRRGM